jgi:hypothetical protein
VKELNVSTSVGLSIRVEDSASLFLYDQYGTRWEKPANKPVGIRCTVNGGLTSNRTARVVVDKKVSQQGSGASRIPDDVAARIGYNGRWRNAGHMVANSLGGPGGYTSNNIVPMTFAANNTNPGMKGIETAVLSDIRTADAVYDYSVSVSYDPSVQLPPVEVVVNAVRLYPNATLPSAVQNANKTIDNK